MRLIVTRPTKDAVRLIAKLRDMGHEAVSAPMISIEFHDGLRLPKRDWQAVLTTSANGIRALVNLSAHEELRDVKVLAVGPASSEAAEAAGFRNIMNADGDLSALVDLAKNTLDTSGGPLLYPSGNRVSGDLKGQMEQLGFECVRLPLYDAHVAEGIPLAVAKSIRNGEIDGVLLYSPRTARIWADRVRDGGLASHMCETVHWCLSAAVGDALAQAWTDHVPPPTRLSREPNEASLLEAIRTDRGKPGSL